MHVSLASKEQYFGRLFSVDGLLIGYILLYCICPFSSHYIYIYIYIYLYKAT